MLNVVKPLSAVFFHPANFYVEIWPNASVYGLLLDATVLNDMLLQFNKIRILIIEVNEHWQPLLYSSNINSISGHLVNHDCDITWITDKGPPIRYPGGVHVFLSGRDISFLRIVERDYFLQMLRGTDYFF